MGKNFRVSTCKTCTAIETANEYEILETRKKMGPEIAYAAGNLNCNEGVS
jgi:hypothetical protein